MQEGLLVFTVWGVSRPNLNQPKGQRVLCSLALGILSTNTWLTLHKIHDSVVSHTTKGKLMNKWAEEAINLTVMDITLFCGSKHFTSHPKEWIMCQRMEQL